MSRKIRLLYLENISPVRSQTIYHAVGYGMKEDTPDTIILVSPERPYVCIGYHQYLNKEVDMEYCMSHGLPVLRREVGGGAVYLDNGQLFSQWVFHRERFPPSLEKRYRMYIDPMVETYKELDINANHRPINDIHVDGKKIGGTGAAQMGIAEVVVGSLMFSFDKNTMSKVLKVSSEKMRDKIHESLEEYMTTMEEQLNYLPERLMVKEKYINQVEKSLGVDVYEGELTPDEEAIAVDLDKKFISSDWIYQKGGLREESVKIHHDVHIVEGDFKAPGGLIRVILRINKNRIDDISISGDFTLLPSFALGELEQSVKGATVNSKEIRNHLESKFVQMGILSPGVTSTDFTAAIMGAAASLQNHQINN